ncbi:MAG TPA: helicase-related protein [Oculatellaceae cyanobacterium]|jgi:superfamily II DNA/RNA helicase
MQNLATGFAGDRRQTVEALVEQIKAGQFRIVDARAMRHHAKVYLVDCEIGIVTSANLTVHGLTQQVEAGALLAEKEEVIKMVEKFDEHFAKATDLTQELLNRLECWLKLVSPWDAYLKTLLTLEDKALDSEYTLPTAYQRAMIAETLRKIMEHDGTMLVASTGLGKTVVATHVALQLLKANEIKNVLLIGPKLVKKQWEHEFLQASISFKYIGYQALDKEDSKYDGSLEDFFEIEPIINKKWLIIIDESHLFRDCHDSLDGPKRRSFQRLVSLIEKSGCKVLLLTGSPYSTGIKNLNAQLRLLPNTAEINIASNTRGSKPFEWRTNNIEEFINLPVVSQLTTPHVAKSYGKSVKNGVSIDFGEEKRYIPRVMLSRCDFTLFLESELAQAFRNGCFIVEGRPFQRRTIERHAEVAWVSSPWAIREVLQKVINTPGEPNSSYKFEFEMPQSQRRERLEPILNQLKKMMFNDDPKLLYLCFLLKKIYSSRKKVIIFCERRATVVYLVTALNNLVSKLRVFGTIRQRQNQYEHKSDREILQAIKKFAPIANKIEIKNNETYDVFISTDAHGIGINLQDAPIVINYDLSWTPIEITQRAGRVLRPWIKSRIIDLYTFVPPLTNDALRNLGIARRWRKLIDRHSQSQKILDLPVLSIQEAEEQINPSDVASKVTVQLGELDLYALDSGNVSAYYQHLYKSRLHSNRNYARKILDDIVSAKKYPGQTVLVYVLFKYNDKYNWAIYEEKSKSLQKISVVQLLDWLECDRDTPRAIVSGDEIDNLSDDCIREWCNQHKADPDDVIRVCTVYLKPEQESDELKDFARS